MEKKGTDKFPRKISPRFTLSWPFLLLLERYGNPSKSMPSLRKVHRSPDKPQPVTIITDRYPMLPEKSNLGVRSALFQLVHPRIMKRNEYLPN